MDTRLALVLAILVLPVLGGCAAEATEPPTLATDAVVGGTPASVTETPEPEAPSTSVDLQLVAEGFTSPVDFEPDPTGQGRDFVVDQVGPIHVLDAGGRRMDAPFLDLSDRIVALDGGYDERGVLGLAFHPGYSQNGRLFVYYSAPLRDTAPADWDSTSVLSEFQVSDDPDVADPDSERILLEIDQPQSNHNGGDIAFGPDGYLYVPLGDGGGANDTGLGHTDDIGNGQDPTNRLGSILRIDVDGEEPYAIPADNPFANDEDVPDETFAWGFRNPWRATFDAGGDRRYFVGDAGQDRWEEVSIVNAGANYGWNIVEGTHCFDPENPEADVEGCPDIGPRGNPLVPPILEYRNANQPDGFGYVVVGGYVYRGSALPDWDGAYLFGDWSASRGTGDGVVFVATEPEAGRMWEMDEIAFENRTDRALGAYLLAFGQDDAGELYILTSDMGRPAGNTGKVWRIVPTETATELEAEGRTPSVGVGDQTLVDGRTVTVRRVVARQDGWIVIHADDGGQPGAALGHAAVSAGENENVAVEIDGPAATGTLHAMLHVDAGETGQYEVPGPDAPEQNAQGQVVVQSFELVAGPDDEEPMGDEETTAVSVSMVDTTFEPTDLSVPVGTTVTWTNEGVLAHTVTADDGSFDSGELRSGDTFRHTFEEAGSFPYYCAYHGGPGGEGMAGVVTVE